MIYLLDTADLSAIKHCNEFYPLAGVTTNPSIISKANTDFWPLVEEIRKIIGPDKMLHVQTTKETAEEIVEEAAEPAPAAEEPTAVSDEKKALFDAFAAIADKSFTERLDSVDPEIKAFYEQVREELLSYDKVKSRLSQKGESFRVGRVLLAKIAISGKTVKCYLALDPTAYDVKTYRHADASERKAFADVPMLVRIRSKLSVKRTAQLIADLAAKNGLVKK